LSCGATSIFLAALLELFGVIAQISVWSAVLALPVFAYEMSLAGWLITRGFSDSATSSEAEEAGRDYAAE
jgi:hypothetical protein